MSKSEGLESLNAAGVNPGETGAINPGRKLESGLAAEGLEKANLEKELGKPELSPEEQAANLKEETEARQEEITKLAESIEGTKARINEVRESLGLPPTEEDPPSVLSDKENLEKLRSEKEDLEKQSEELVSEIEKERLIREEKEKILQEKIDALFKEFESLNLQDLESILKTGKTRQGEEVESEAMGELDPEEAKSLAEAFKEGIRLLPRIVEIFPELLKKLDEELEKEATERVEKKLEEEKEKLEEQEKEKAAEEKPQDAAESSGDAIPQEESAQGQGVSESAGASPGPAAS